MLFFICSFFIPICLSVANIHSYSLLNPLFRGFLITANLWFRFLCLDNVDLGTACGKYFRVSCLSILDPGIALLLWLCCHCFICSYYTTKLFSIMMGLCLIFQVILISSNLCPEINEMDNYCLLFGLLSPFKILAWLPFSRKSGLWTQFCIYWHYYVGGRLFYGSRLLQLFRGFLIQCYDLIFAVTLDICFEVLFHAS